MSKIVSAGLLAALAAAGSIKEVTAAAADLFTALDEDFDALELRVSALETVVSDFDANDISVEHGDSAVMIDGDAMAVHLANRLAIVENKVGIAPPDPSTMPGAKERREAAARGEPVPPLVPPTATVAGVLPG